MSDKKPKKKAPKKPVKSPAKKPTKKPGKKKTAVKKQKTYIAIVLDQSGSMQSIALETIKSFNDQINTIQKESVGMDTKIMFTTFDHQVSHVFFDVAVDKLQTLTEEIYKPNGYTAMYDGICMTIDKMEKELLDINDPDVAVLFTIITDGAENSSKFFTNNHVAEKIKRLRGTNRWTFNLIGANIDLEKASADLNISKGNILKISSSSAGMVRGMTASTNSIGNYMSTRRAVSKSDDLSALSEQCLYSADGDILDVSDDTVNKK